MSTRSIETGNLGFPRIGLHRELKFALERFWAGEWNAGQLETAGRRVRGERWQMQVAVAAARRVREATRAAPTVPKDRQMTFSLEPVPPFRLDLTAWAIRRRPENLMDRWDGKSYRRVLAIDADGVRVTVTQSGGKRTPQLHVVAIAAGRGVPKKARIAAAIERLLGTCVDLRPFYRFAAGEPRLHELAARFRGLKPPRFPTVFEAVVNGIACQQLSLAVGITLLNRLSAACGLSFPDADGVQYAFPRPADLAAMNIEDLLPLGLSRNKSRAIIETASEVAEGRLDLESFANLENEEALARLRELRGVGRWTAEYVLLRGLGRTNLFPGDDVGARNNLSRWMRLRKPLDYDRVGGVLRKWKPFAGLIYFHLLLSGLEHSGKLPADASVGDRLTSRRYGAPRAIGN